MRSRRRTNAQDDPLARAFGLAAARIDHAQRMLLEAVPTARDPGIPLKDALVAFLHGLDEADAAMTAWKEDRVAHEWTNCSDGIAEARAAAERLLAMDLRLTFEQLNAQIGEVLYPLEAFIDAERSMKRR